MCFSDFALTAKLTSVVAEFNDDGGQRRISVELDVPAERQRSTSDAVQQDLGGRFWRLDDGQLDVGRVAAERVLCRADVQTAVLAPSGVDRQPRPHHRLQRPRCGCSCRRLEVESLQPVSCTSNHVYSIRFPFIFPYFSHCISYVLRTLLNEDDDDDDDDDVLQHM